MSLKLWPKKFLWLNSFIYLFFCWPKFLRWPKTFLSPHFLAPHFLLTQIFVLTVKLWLKIFLWPKLFDPKLLATQDFTMIQKIRPKSFGSMACDQDFLGRLEPKILEVLVMGLNFQWVTENNIGILVTDLKTLKNFAYKIENCNCKNDREIFWNDCKNKLSHVWNHEQWEVHHICTRNTFQSTECFNF